jgi:hypothetical protein
LRVHIAVLGMEKLLPGKAGGSSCPLYQPRQPS